MSETAPFLRSAPELEQHISELVEDITPEVAVVGSAATFLAMPDTARYPRDIDLSVSAAGYTELRRRFSSDAAWTERVLPDGRCLLTNGAYDIAVGWGVDMPHHQLMRTGWQTPRHASGHGVAGGGLAVASLSYLCHWKLRRHEAKDIADNEQIRLRLHDPTMPLLPLHALRREAEIIRAHTPETLWNGDDAEAVLRIAAHGLLTVSALYGGPDLRYAGQIVGALERPEYNVHALYHNGFDLPEDIGGLVQHLQRIGCSRQDILDGVMGATYADSVYGNGRASDNADGGYDELLSARLLQSHALAAGLGAARAARLFNIVDSTAFNEATKVQKGKASPDPVARGVVGVDLLSLSRPGLPFDIVLEDCMSARYSPTRILGKVANEHGVHLRSVAEALAFVDAYENERPADAPDGSTIRDAVLNRLEVSGRFQATYEYPEGWTLDNRAFRQQHAAYIQHVVSTLRADPKARLAAFYVAP